MHLVRFFFIADDWGRLMHLLMQATQCDTQQFMIFVHSKQNDVRYYSSIH